METELMKPNRKDSFEMYRKAKNSQKYYTNRTMTEEKSRF